MSDPLHKSFAPRSKYSDKDQTVVTMSTQPTIQSKSTINLEGFGEILKNYEFNKDK